MADIDNLQIDGYRFGSREDVEAAGEEVRKISYFKEKTKGKSPHMLLALYDKLLDEKVFKTPVGWEYLRELQEQLKEAGIPEDEIRPISFYMNFSYKTGEELNRALTRQRIRPAKKKVNVNAFQISVCTAREATSLPYTGLSIVAAWYAESLPGTTQESRRTHRPGASLPAATRGKIPPGASGSRGNHQRGKGR